MNHLERQAVSTIIRIRPYESQDLECCRALWQDLTQWHREIYEDPTIGGDQPGRGFDEHLTKQALAGLWLAVYDSTPAGLVGLLLDGREGIVEPVIVAPAYRFRGVGHALLRFITEEARRRRLQYLSVRPVARNLEAVACFHSAGFRTLGHIDMFQELGPATGGPWKTGIAIHGRRFRY